MASSCTREGLGWILERVSSLKGLSSPGTSAQGRVESPPLEGFQSCVEVALGDRDRVSAGLGSAGEGFDLMMLEDFPNNSVTL